MEYYPPGGAPNGATGSYDGGTAGGSANALTATVSGLGSSPSTGNVVILKTSAANTGAATLAINSGSAIAIKNQDGTTALAGGEMASAKYYLLEYNGTNWVLLNPVVSATDNTKVAKSGDTMSGALYGVAFLLQATANPGAGNHGFTRDGLLNMVLNAATGQAVILGYNNNGLNTGTGCLSWGSFGVKIASTGGTGHVLKQTSAGGAISSGALTTSDLHAIRFDAPLVDGQSLSFGDYNYLQTGTPTTNNLFTVSGTGNITFTSLYAGVLEIYVSIAADKFEGMLRVEKNGSFVREGFVNAFVNRVTIATAVPIAIGDVIKMNAYSSGSATLVVGSGAGTLFMALRS